MNNSSNGFWEDPKNMLAGVIQAFNVITNRNDYKNKITKQPISFNGIKIMYKGFYAGYQWLINNKKISGEKKRDLIAKKKIVDVFFNNDKPKINYITEENKMLNKIKKIANRIPTTNTNVNAFASNLSKLKL
jgi:hypothetical protein